MLELLASGVNANNAAGVGAGALPILFIVFVIIIVLRK